MNVPRSETRHPWLDRLLQRAGIEPRPFRALLHAYLLIDFRNQSFARATASGPKAWVSPLFWVVGQSLLFSWILSALLFARVDVFFFTLLSLGASALVMATALVVEFNEVVLDPEDLETVAHLPVSLRTYSAARVTNLLGYILLITVSLNIYPAIIGAALRDSSWFYLPTYLAGALVCNFAVCGLVILAYAVVLGRPPTEPVREVLAWNQIILIMVAFYGGQLALRDSQDRLEMAAYQFTAYQVPAWLAYLPAAWRPLLVEASGAVARPLLWSMLGVGALLTVAIWWVVFRKLSTVYSKMQPGARAWQRSLLASLPRPGELAGWFGRRVTRPHEERAAFWLCWTMLGRDFNLRMRTWPTLGTAIAAAVLGWATGQLRDPIAEPGPACVLSLVAIYLLAVPPPLIFYNLNFSREHEASWLLWTSPIEDRLAFAEGIRKAVMYRILLPTLAAMLVLFALVWRDPLDVAVHGLTGLLVVVGAGYASQMGVLRSYPLSAPAARGEISGPIAPFAAAVSSVAMALATIHYFAAPRPLWLGAYLAALTGAVLVLRAVAGRSVQLRFAREVAAYD